MHYRSIITAIAIQLATVAQAEGIVKFQETFNDPQDLTAQSLAQFEGVTVEEARRRLVLMNEASRLGVQLEKSYPDLFAGINITSTPHFEVEVTLKGRDLGVSLLRVMPFVKNAELSEVLQISNSTYSRTELMSLGKSIVSQLGVNGVKANVAVDAASDTITILTRDTNSVEALLTANTIKAFGFEKPVTASIEYFDGIQETAALYGGAAYNTTSTNCTTGFTVMRFSDRVKGISSAGHCGGSAKYSEYVNTNYYSPDGTPLNVRYRYTNNLDVLMASAVGSGHDHRPVFRDGSSPFPTVTGGAYDATGLYVCRQVARPASLVAT